MSTWIAEGVEPEEQLDCLRLRGRKEIQGHYFSQALASTVVERILREGRGLQTTAAEAGTRWSTSGW